MDAEDVGEVRVLKLRDDRVEQLEDAQLNGFAGACTWVNIGSLHGVNFGVEWLLRKADFDAAAESMKDR